MFTIRNFVLLLNTKSLHLIVLWLWTSSVDSGGSVLEKSTTRVVNQLSDKLNNNKHEDNNLHEDLVTGPRPPKYCRVIYFRPLNAYVFMIN